MKAGPGIPVAMEEVACPACRTAAADWLQATTDRFMCGPGTFRYARCAGCGLVYLKLRPPVDELGTYYPPGYIRTGRAPAAVRQALRQHDLAPYAALAGRQPGRRLLDVGCSRGDFLALMRDRHWIVAGVEPTAWLADQALARGLPVWPRTLADAPLPPSAFDVATMWDVLEHLPDPVADLRRLGAALRPGGRLLVNTPVTDGWDARLFGTAWSGWDAPRHLVVFSRATLASVLERAGYRVVGWARVFETYLITALTLSLLARPRAPKPVAGIVWHALHARPTRLAAAPLFAGLDAAGGPSSVTAVAEWRGA